MQPVKWEQSIKASLMTIISVQWPTRNAPLLFHQDVHTVTGTGYNTADVRPFLFLSAETGFDMDSLNGFRTMKLDRNFYGDDQVHVVFSLVISRSSIVGGSCVLFWVYCMPVLFRTHVYSWRFAGVCMQGKTTQRHEVCAWLLGSSRTCRSFNTPKRFACGIP